LVDRCSAERSGHTVERAVSGRGFEIGVPADLSHWQAQVLVSVAVF
jgi:hypothetical protein